MLYTRIFSRIGDPLKLNLSVDSIDSIDIDIDSTVDSIDIDSTSDHIVSTSTQVSKIGPCSLLVSVIEDVLINTGKNSDNPDTASNTDKLTCDKDLKKIIDTKNDANISDFDLKMVAKNAISGPKNTEVKRDKKVKMSEKNRTKNR